MEGIKLPMQDKTWGIERNPDSPLYGRLVVGTKTTAPILLWKKPGVTKIAKNLTGALLHNKPVTITKQVKYKKDLYYFAQTVISHDGKEYHQKGWLRPLYLKELGGNHG